MSGSAFGTFTPWQKPTKRVAKRRRWRPKPCFRSSVSLEDWHNVALVRPSLRLFGFYVGLGLKNIEPSGPIGHQFGGLLVTRGSLWTSFGDPWAVVGKVRFQDCRILAI